MGTSTMDEAPYQVGVDIGGTFTDFVVFDAAASKVHHHKVPSTPTAPWTAVIEGLKQLDDRGVLDPADVGYFVHGTTLAINTLIEHNGAETGLVVTAGFEDILEIRRLRLPDPLDFFNEPIAPLVRRNCVRGVDERIGPDGDVIEPIDKDEVRYHISGLVDHGCDSVAVCLLHAYENDIHEQAAVDTIEAAFPEVYVSASADIWPQEREYERALITVINAYIGDRMDEYFSRLTAELSALGIEAPVLSTKSNGGVMTAASASHRPVETLFSGPASGVVGARWAATSSGIDRLITFDMGGTSADVSVVDGEPVYSTDASAGGYTVMMPSIDVTAIGAGGGSIAWVDDHGVLKVGPESAGSVPGPACYDRGGTDPTITDAYFVLNLLNPERFSGGELPIDVDLAEEAVAVVGETLDMAVEDVATSILDVATAKMHSKLTPLLASRGVEADEFTLVPYGGAGPTHSFFLAEELGLSKLVIPESPGTMSAMGCLVADFRADFVRSFSARLDDLDAVSLQHHFEALEHEAIDWLREEEFGLEGQHIVREAEMRFVGQSYEVTTPVPTGTFDELRTVEESFYQAYEDIYNFVDRSEAIEITDLRVQVVGETPTPAAEPIPSATKATAAHSTASKSTMRSVYLDDRWVTVPVFDRSTLEPGEHFTGSAVVDQDDTTVVIPRSFTVEVDAAGNLIGRRQSA